MAWGVLAEGQQATFHCLTRCLQRTFYCLTVSPGPFTTRDLGFAFCIASIVQENNCATLQQSEQEISDEVLCALNIHRRNILE